MRIVFEKEILFLYSSYSTTIGPPFLLFLCPKFNEDPQGNLGVFLISSLILGTASSAATMRMMRTMMLEVLRQDYIRTTWSKGLKERVVIIRHTIKNALIPVVTRSVGLISRAAAAQILCGLQLPILVGAP